MRAVIAFVRELVAPGAAQPAPVVAEPDPDVVRRMIVYTNLARRRPLPVIAEDWCEFVDDLATEERVVFVAGASLAHGGRCPVCGDGESSRPVCVCRICEAVHHVDCWSYTGRCARYGCGSEWTRSD